MRTQHIARAILLSAIVFFLTGCQVFSPVGEFISKRYTNTASYFNTYYNAQKSFSDAESEVLTGMEAGREKSAKGQTVSFVVSSTARTKFTSSIEKNSKLLSYYPTSKFVDDALLMIGKAYFYLGEDLKAERKFLELIAQFPESNLIPETKLWYGKSLLRQKKTAEGIQQLDALFALAKQDGDDDVAGQAALVLGSYYFDQEDYENALKYYSNSLETLGDGVENARTQFQVGLCYNKLGDYAAAENAFRNVEHFKPDYTTTFRAAVYQSRMLTQLKKYNPALDLLFAKLDDSKYKEYAATAHREVGNIYAAEGNIAEAVAQYRFVDTAYARTDDAARSMFALAGLYETALLQFDSARVYYDKARLEFPSSEVTPAAVMKAESFGKYFSVKRDLGYYDTLITDMVRPGWRKKDPRVVMREDSLRRVDSITAARKVSKPIDLLNQRNLETSGKSPDTSFANRPFRVPGDSTSGRMELPGMSRARELSADERDSVRQADSLAVVMKALAERQKLDSLTHQVARMKFELAGLLYLELNRPDSALVYYTEVVHTTKDSMLAARAYYTMADLYRTGDSTSHAKVDSLYQAIITIAPASSYAQEARKNLGMPLQNIVQDSSEAGYLHAEELLNDGKPEKAIQAFRAVTEAYPKSPYTAKALYTIGWIYENTAVDNDSAEAAYRRLIVRYPASIYAATVQPKLNEIAVVRREAEAKAKLEKDEADRKAKEQEAKLAKEAKDKADAEKKNALERGSAGSGAASDSAAVNIPHDSTGAAQTGNGLKLPAPGDSLKAASPGDSLKLTAPGDSLKVPVPRNTTKLRSRKEKTNPVAPDSTRVKE